MTAKRSPLRTLSMLTAMMMGGIRTSPRPELEPLEPSSDKPPPRVPMGDDGKQMLTTDARVVCVYCEAYEDAGKGCSPKSSAIVKGWKKIDEKHFLCPECRG